MGLSDIKTLISIKKKYFFVLFLAVLSTGYTFGQSLQNSPYSRYGIGDVQPQKFSQNLAMGGISFGSSNPHSINLSNPASYSFLELTTLETGLMNNYTKLITDSLNQNTWNTAMSYLAIGLPVTKKWGASFGILPFSKVGYDILYNDNLDNIGDVTYKYTGTGGVSQIYIGSSCLIHKNLSFGINASYLFGSMKHENKLEFPGNSSNYNLSVIDKTTVGDVSFNYGIQYAKPLKEEKKIVFGVAGSTTTKIKSERTLESKTYLLNSLNEMIVKDTIANIIDTGQIILPAYIGTGFSYGKNNKFLIGSDFFYSNSSSFRNFDKNDSLKNSWSVSLGGMYLPDVNAVSNYFKRIAYFGGIKYTQTPLVLKGIQLDEYSINAGICLPLSRIKSKIVIAVELMQRGTTNNNLLKEQAIKVNIGFTFNDKWFVRPKFD